MNTKRFFTCLILLLAVCLWAIVACADDVAAHPDCDDVGHDWELESAVGATCSSPAWYSYRCKRCNASKNEPHGEAMEHQWVDDGTTYPGCETWGLEQMHCALCGKEWRYEIEPLGHDWKAGEILHPAGCETTGARKMVCEACNMVEIVEVEPAGHDWKTTKVLREATCTSEGKAEVECRVCGKEATRTLKKTEHTYGEWTVTKQPTEKAKGTRTATCLVCGKKTKESIEYVPGDIAIYTRTGKVNLRAGAGKNYKQTAQVAKKGTYLGHLYESAPDKNGDVWYKVKYDGKFRWVMADYANAIVDEDALGNERLPRATGAELSSYFFRSVGPVMEVLALEEASVQGALSGEWQNESVYISGDDYVEQIALYGEGYSLYGVKVGDKIKNVQKALDKKSLVLVSQSDDCCTYRIPALPDALSVDKAGFCGYLIVNVNADKTVHSIQLYSDTAEYIYSID